MAHRKHNPRRQSDLASNDATLRALLSAVSDTPHDYAVLPLAVAFLRGEFEADDACMALRQPALNILRGLSLVRRVQLEDMLSSFMAADDVGPARIVELTKVLRHCTPPHGVERGLLAGAMRKIRQGRTLQNYEVLNLALAFQYGKFPPDLMSGGVHFETATLSCMANAPRGRRERYAEILRQTNDVDDAAMNARTERLLDALASGQSTDPVDIALSSAAEWDRASTGVTAREHFDIHFAQIPRSHRPFAHIVRARARAYYEALASRQSRAGQSLDDLFPIDPNAVGAKRLTKEQAAASNARRREKTRQRVAAFRERQKHAPS